MKENTIISLADSNYFELLNELIDSIKNFKQSQDVAICILDAGLQENQKEILTKKVDEIKKANWDIKVPSYKVIGKEWLKSQVSRAFLPEYFPGYKKYLWIDADAWVNSWEAVELYFEGSSKDKLAISTSADRSYGRVLRAEWLIGGFARIKSQNYKHAKSSGFSEKIARSVALKPHLNIGVFCLNEKAPHWEIWQENLRKALKSGKIFGSEQIAMNIVIYVDNLKVEILPAYCNWTLVDKMKFDTGKNTFVEPYLPNHEIGIVHLAGKNNNNIRLNKNYLSDITTLEGHTIKKCLRFKIIEKK
jgi:lipopolysaccharide biosynthesis glycosyltransferase